MGLVRLIMILNNNTGWKYTKNKLLIFSDALIFVYIKDEAKISVVNQIFLSIYAYIQKDLLRYTEYY